MSPPLRHSDVHRLSGSVPVTGQAPGAGPTSQRLLPAGAQALLATCVGSRGGAGDPGGVAGDPGGVAIGGAVIPHSPAALRGALLIIYWFLVVASAGLLCTFGSRGPGFQLPFSCSTGSRVVGGFRQALWGSGCLGLGARRWAHPGVSGWRCAGCLVPPLPARILVNVGQPPAGPLPAQGHPLGAGRDAGSRPKRT